MSARPRTRSWVVFFAILTLLVAAAVGLETWYNLRQQLSPEILEQARTLWQEKGPADYDLKYTVTRQSRSGERLHARLHGGEVADIEIDGEPLNPALVGFHNLAPLFAEVPPSPAGAERELTAVAPERWTVTYRVQVRRGQAVRAWCGEDPVPAPLEREYAMPALFEGLGQLLEHDRSVGGWRPYSVAIFDRVDGHLLHYVRSQMRTRERLEFNLVEWKPGPETGPVQAPSPP